MIYNGNSFLVGEEAIKLLFKQTRVRKKVEKTCAKLRQRKERRNNREPSLLTCNVVKTFYDTQNLCQRFCGMNIFFTLKMGLKGRKAENHWIRL